MSGRLIRKSAYRGDPNASSYIVAISDAAEAIELEGNKVGAPGDIENWGRVSGPLVRALHLPDGDFVRPDGKELSLARAGGK